VSQYPNQPNEYPGQPPQSNPYPQQPYSYYPPSQPSTQPSGPYYPPSQPSTQPSAPYYPPPPPYYPPPPQQRKKSKVPLILGVIVGVLLLSCIGFGILGATTFNKIVASSTSIAHTTKQNNQLVSTPAPASQQYPTPTAANTSTAHFKIGDVVKINDEFQMSVDGAKTSLGDDFNKPTKSSDTLILVDVTIKNLSAEEEHISSLLQFHIHGVDGQKYAERINTNANAPDGKLEPGDTLKGTLTYEVPLSVHQYVFAFEPSIIEPGQTQWDVTI